MASSRPRPSQKRKTLHFKKKELESDTTNLVQFAERWAPNFYIQRREGQVLSRGMLLKYDIFPSSKIVRTDVSISGAANYRRIDDALPLYAVGQPAIHGIRTILNMLIGSPHYIKMQTRLQQPDGSESELLTELHTLADGMVLMPPRTRTSSLKEQGAQTRRRCIWINLREEPVLYVNNRPFVLRDADHPFRNIQTFKGITWTHLREVEERLKSDILIEASQHHNILIHREDRKKQVFACWEAVTHHTVQTSEEAFTRLISEGYGVHYHRVPITPEGDVLSSTIDDIFEIVVKQMVQCRAQGTPLPHMVVNCQLGRGRSTAVSILVWLILKKSQPFNSAFTFSREHQQQLVTTKAASPNLLLTPAKMAHNRRTFSLRKSSSTGTRLSHLARRPATMSSAAKQISAVTSEEDEEDAAAVDHGDYEVIHRILRVLEHGRDSKRDVDAAIEACGSLYNLRREMKRCRFKLEHSETDDEKELAVFSTVSVLNKYCTLICFAAFLRDVAEFAADYDFKQHSFSAWMVSYPSLQKIKRDVGKLQFGDLMNNYQLKFPTSIHAVLISNRRGSVLSANTILKADIVASNDAMMSSRLPINERLDAIRFRFLEDVDIVTCGTPPAGVIESILKNKLKMSGAADEQKVNAADDDGTDVIWIDLREEPILYIGDRPFAVRNYHRPRQRLPEFDNLLKAQQIASIAQRLKADIVAEMQENDNKLLVHFETAFGEVKESNLAVDKNEIRTTQEIFTALRRQKGYKISYLKLPFLPGAIKNYDQLQRLGAIITESLEKDSTIIFSCRQGIHRSSVAAVLSILIAYHMGTLSYVDQDDDSVDEAFKSNFTLHLKLSLHHNSSGGRSHPSSPERRPSMATHESSPLKMPLSGGHQPSLPSSPMTELNLRGDDVTHNQQRETRAGDDESTDAYAAAECNAVLALMRILRKGRAMKGQVDAAIERCSEFHHIKDAIYASRAKWENARTAQEGQAYLREAMRHLRVYTNLICFNAYLYEYYHAKKYNESVAQKYTLVSFTEWMSGRAELTLWSKQMRADAKLSLAMNEMASLEQKQEEKEFARVFENRGKTSSVLSGNAMLKVDFFPGCSQLEAHPDTANAINFRFIDEIGVCGVAIPTSIAMHQVVLLCAQKTQHIRWVCLREEPVLYVNDEPLVLREVHQPYENLVFTGITSKRVEAMEKTLKTDATTECAKFNNKLLIHSESDAGDLEAEWETVDFRDIRTCREAFTLAFKVATAQLTTQTAIDCVYHRLPITDEQAPSPLVVDTFMRLFESSPNDAIFVFNCQMGRGRTTTAMVIYALWKRRCCELAHAPPQQPQTQSQSQSTKDETTESLLRGEFNAVMTLLRSLPKAKLAKKSCDEVLDTLAQMQNLRQAIYQMKLRRDKAVSEKSKALLQHRTINYLQRYCLLIAFASYLVNDYDCKNLSTTMRFETWLQQRAAVKNCIYSAALNED